MQELRFVAVSEDGSYAVLAVPGRSARFVLPIDERLRAVATGQTSRLAQYEIEVESPLRPKEIQARIRAGETAEEIADAAGIPVERVRWFEGPVLAERAYIAQQAQTATVRRLGDSAGPGPHLGDIVAERMSASGADPEDGQWDSRKRGDGTWQVQLTYSAAGQLRIAEWMFDPRRRHVMPEDDTAARLSLPESEFPPLPEPMPGEATVTPIAPRLGAAAGMGAGMSGGMSGGQAPRVTPRQVASPPASERRPAAPWSDSARRAPEPAAYRPDAYQPDSYQSDSYQSDAYRGHEPEFEFEPAPPALDGARVPEAPDPAPTPASVPAPEPAPAPEPTAEAAPAEAAPAEVAEAVIEAVIEAAVVETEAGSARKAPPAKKAAAKKEPAVAEEPPAEEPAAAEQSAPTEQLAPGEERAPRRPAKKNPRNRRSSVPSWDEIMLGSSRQHD